MSVLPTAIEVPRRPSVGVAGILVWCPANRTPKRGGVEVSHGGVPRTSPTTLACIERLAVASALKRAKERTRGTIQT